MSESQQEESFDKLSEAGAKQIVLNTYNIAGEDINRKQAWRALTDADVLDIGYEYFRRTYKEALEGEHDVAAAADYEIQRQIETILSQAGVIDDADKTDRGENASTSESSDTTGARRTDSPSEGKVVVEDLRDLRDRIALLNDMVEFEAQSEEPREYRKAQFIAREALDGIDELLEQSD